MHDGNVEQIGTPLELYDHPGNVFVAGFIGSPAMNFVEGVVRRGNGKMSVEAADGTSLPLRAHAPGQDGQRVIYGTRPEHLGLGTEGDGVAATVVVVEPTGASTQVYVSLASAQLCAVFEERHDFAPGKQIHLRPRLDCVHVFDAATGKHL
jgi:multiple sugar transport system ATP-binding protein